MIFLCRRIDLDFGDSVRCHQHRPRDGGLQKRNLLYILMVRRMKRSLPMTEP